MNTPIFKKAALCLSLATLCGLTVLAQHKADASRPVEKDELVYLPNEKLLTHFTAGMSSVIADLLWLRCVQFTGAEFKAEHDFTWLNQMLNTIVRMDPYFKEVYRYGAIFLAGVKADDSAALDLLHRGMVQRPDAWELPYEAGMIYLLNRREQPGARKLAAYYLAMSAATGKSNTIVAETAAALQAENNLDDIESEMWASMLEKGDKVLRDLAARKQQELVIRQNLKTLQDNVDRFVNEQGRTPKDMDELVQAGYFGDAAKSDRGFLNDPLGGHYFIDANGKPQDTALLDAERDKLLAGLRDAVKQYHEKNEAYPLSLDVLVPGFLPGVPRHPYTGQDWRYTPATGDIAG